MENFTLTRHIEGKRERGRKVPCHLPDEGWGYMVKEKTVKDENL